MLCAELVTALEFSCDRDIRSRSRTLLRTSNDYSSREIRVMARPVKAIATLASLAVLACSILAISWVGLALLGY